jgi:hypothetical protein
VASSGSHLAACRRDTRRDGSVDRAFPVGLTRRRSSSVKNRINSTASKAKRGFPLWAASAPQPHRNLCPCWLVDARRTLPIVVRSTAGPHGVLAPDGTSTWHRVETPDAPRSLLWAADPRWRSVRGMGGNPTSRRPLCRLRTHGRLMVRRGAWQRAMEPGSGCLWAGWRPIKALERGSALSLFHHNP